MEAASQLQAGAIHQRIEGKFSAGGEERGDPSAPWQGFLGAILKPVMSVTVVVATIGTLALYAYLQGIGWPELLWPSIGTYHGLTLIFAALIVICAAFLITFYGSAFWIHGVAQTYRQAGFIPRRLGWLIVGLHLIWLLELTLVLYGSQWKALVHACWFERFAVWFSERNLLPMAILTGAGALASVALHRRARRHFTARSLRAKAAQMVTDVWRGALLAWASISSSLSSLATLAINPSLRKHEMSLELAMVLLPATLPGIVVGVAYLYTYRRTGKARASLREVGVFAAAIAAAVCLLFPAATILPVDFLSLGAISVYSLSKRTYQLTKPDAKAIYTKAGFPIEEGNGVTFSGYERYRFGDILLLCTAPYDPMKTSDAAQKVNSRASDASGPRHGCILARSDEVRRIEPSSGQ